MSDDLITWLRAQLDEDERVAQEAGSRSLMWPVNGTWHLEGVEHDVVGQEEAFCHPYNVEHIARHDPARVLAEVDAKRALIAETIRPYLGVETTTGRVAWLALRLLTLPYADRPGYREEWRP